MQCVFSVSKISLYDLKAQKRHDVCAVILLRLKHFKLHFKYDTLLLNHLRLANNVTLT